MHVHMKHFLPALFAHVHNNAVTIQAQLAGYPVHRSEQRSKFSFTAFVAGIVGKFCRVFFWNHQHVNGGFGVNVVKGNNVRVRIDLFRR